MRILEYTTYEQISSHLRGVPRVRDGSQARKRDDEETLRRLIGGPHPEDVAGILSSETATAMRDRLEDKRKTDAEEKHKLRERFE